MPFLLSLMPRSSIPELVQLQLAAFEFGPVRIICFPNGLSPSSIDKAIDRFHQAMDESNKYFVQIVDTDTGKMVACAVWEYTKSMSHEDWEQKRRERPEYPEARQEVLQVMYQGVAEKRINLMGSSRYWELLSLQTLPAYSRQGLGSQLVAWGTKKSDETGVPAFIESTEQGAGLYKKHGFQEVATVPVDLEQWAHWGGKGTYTNTFFSREPHTSGEM